MTRSYRYEREKDRERVALVRVHSGTWCEWRRRKSLHLLIKQGKREEVRETGHDKSPANINNTFGF